MNPHQSPTLASGHRSSQLDQSWHGFWLFRYRLARLPFAIMLLIHHSWAAWMIDGNYHYKFILVCSSMPLLMVFAVLPRVRDCGWPWWVALTTIIPYLGTVTGFGLLFVLTKVFLLKDDSDTSKTPPTTLTEVPNESTLSEAASPTNSNQKLPCRAAAE